MGTQGGPVLQVGYLKSQKRHLHDGNSLVYRVFQSELCMSGYIMKHIMELFGFVPRTASNKVKRLNAI